MNVPGFTERKRRKRVNPEKENLNLLKTYIVRYLQNGRLNPSIGFLKQLTTEE
jgi:hypothetical protein